MLKKTFVMCLQSILGSLCVTTFRKKKATYTYAAECTQNTYENQLCKNKGPPLENQHRLKDRPHASSPSLI